MYFVNDMPVEQIIAEYESGKDLKEIAKEKNVAISKLQSILIEEGGSKGKEIIQKDLNKKYKIDLSMEDIVNNYKKEKNSKKIADDYGVSEVMINSIINDYELLTGEKILLRKNKGKYRYDVPENIIGKEYKRRRISYARLAKKYHASESTIKRRVDHYEIRKLRKENIVTDENDLDKENKENVSNKSNLKLQRNDSRITISMIYNYLKYGYDLEKIENYVQGLGYTIDKKDIETAQKIQKGELKVATEASIEKIIEKYGYSYEKLVEIGKKKGYVVLEDRYISAKANINNKNKEGETR